MNFKDFVNERNDNMVREYLTKLFSNPNTSVNDIVNALTDPELNLESCVNFTLSELMPNPSPVLTEVSTVTEQVLAALKIRDAFFSGEDLVDLIDSSTSSSYITSCLMRGIEDRKLPLLVKSKAHDGPGRPTKVFKYSKEMEGFLENNNEQSQE